MFVCFKFATAPKDVEHRCGGSCIETAQWDKNYKSGDMDGSTRNKS